MVAKSVNENENSKVYAVVKAENEDIMRISNEYLNMARQKRESVQNQAFIEYLYNCVYALVYLLRIKTDTIQKRLC